MVVVYIPTAGVNNPIKVNQTPPPLGNHIESQGIRINHSESESATWEITVNHSESESATWEITANHSESQ